MSYSVEISYDHYDPLTLKGVWEDWNSAVNYANKLSHSLGCDFRAIVIKEWDNGHSNEIGRITGMTH